MSAIPPWPDGLRDTLRELHDDFLMTPVAMADVTGLSVEDVERACLEFGIGDAVAPLVPEVPSSPVEQPVCADAPAAEPEMRHETAPVRARKRRRKPQAGDEAYIVLHDPARDDPRHDLRVGGCRWIDGDPRREWSRCQEEAVPGTEWCREHKARVYVPYQHRAKPTAA